MPFLTMTRYWQFINETNEDYAINADERDELIQIYENLGLPYSMEMKEDEDPGFPLSF
jgi:hypothetical protein